MTFTRGLFIHPDATRGTTALEARQSLAGLIPGPGVLDGLTVSGTASWQYSVAAGHVATSRGIDTDGVVAFANDAPVLVDCSPAPGTGSRIDIIYAKHNDATSPNADPNADAFAAVAEGIASGTPVAPEIPEGALELGRATVSAGATNTDHANVTISHANQKRALLRGGIVNVSSSDQQNEAYNSTDQRPVFAWREDTNELQVAWGEGWRRIYPAEVEDTGWLDLDRGQFGYFSTGKYRVRAGIVTLNIDLTCASNRPAGTVEIAPPNAAYAHTGNNDMRDLVYVNTGSGSAQPVRIFQDGTVRSYVTPAMSEGERIYGTVTYPAG